MSGEVMRQWHLPDGASCLQAELVVIRCALRYSLDHHFPQVIIHTDFQASIQALRNTQPLDDIHLLTSTLFKSSDWSRVTARSPTTGFPAM